MRRYWWLHKLIHGLRRLARLSGLGRRRDEDVDTLYRLLHQLTHDLNDAWSMPASQTREAFGYQWAKLTEGHYLLTDPWFKANVARILSEEELQIRPEWFRGKEVLDAGCGNGRWSYGLAQLGAHVTAVDADPTAIEATRKALEDIPAPHQVYVAPLEELSRHVPPKQFDLVLCWGVLHHCRSYTTSFREVCGRVKEGGILYLYLYGRESLPLSDDIELFKERVGFYLMSPEDKHRFLFDKAGKDEQAIHNLHDYYAPLINRRFEFSDVRKALESAGFQDVTRTIRHTELFIRAVKGNAAEYHRTWFLPAKTPPYWFEHHER
jgi:2-polyprenyl-3-methyl-5-hydroxy-6-metoxy-1,4-benzoquinol methylase